MKPNKYRVTFGAIIIILSIMSFFQGVWDKPQDIFTELLMIGCFGGFAFGCTILLGET